eukprot:scaffold13307_cov97-Isochrysis_galbana.AAC.10
MAYLCQFGHGAHMRTTRHTTDHTRARAGAAHSDSDLDLDTHTSRCLCVLLLLRWLARAASMRGAWRSGGWRLAPA